MTQEKRWQKRYEKVVGYIEANKRNPLECHIKGHDYLNRLKANRKLMNAG